LIEELAEFATGGDSWTFSFPNGATDDIALSSNGEHEDAKPTVVALFSGGLDSLCGAAHLAAQKKSRPVFVTHSPPGREGVYELTNDVFKAFGRLLPRSACAGYRLEVREADRSGSRSMFQEPTRRTRPIFYLSLAAATAIAYDVHTVQMSENGALALSFPYRADAYGPSMARQAHTFLLSKFKELLTKLVPGANWFVTNPFIDQTKGEACQELGPAGRLASLSESCEYLGRQRSLVQNWMKQHAKQARIFGNGPHCGLCVPCLVRRAALNRAQVADPDASYFASAPSILREVRKRGSAIHLFGVKNVPPLLNMLVPNVLYMERHCNWLATASLSEFAIQYLPELRSNRRLDGGPVMDLGACYKLMQRYAKEILAFLNG
jgi:7-cyano-7-deazaguanine synthase in queuosine biosynthesis